jgi:ribosomal protein L22
MSETPDKREEELEEKVEEAIQAEAIADEQPTAENIEEAIAAEDAVDEAIAAEDEAPAKPAAKAKAKPKAKAKAKPAKSAPEADDEADEPVAEAADADAEAEAPAKPAKRGAKAKAKPAKSAPKAAPTRRRRQPVAAGVEVRAQARYVRTSARKARLVCDHIRGKDVAEARAILAFTPRAAAKDWAKLLESAVANAEHNHELVGDDLRVSAVYADEGPTLKRYRPRAMGRATRIRKRTSHLSITLTPKEL